MAVWQNIKRLFVRSAPENETLLSNPSSWFTDLFSPSTKSGAVVTDTTVLSLPAVSRAIKILSETVASMPFEVYRTDSKGDTQVDAQNPAHPLINSEPSEIYTSFVYRETMMMHLCLRGNFYARIRFKKGSPSELEILNPDRVTVLQNQRKLFYRVDGGNEAVLLQSYEVIHVPAFAFDGIVGKNPIQAHREAFGLALSNSDYASELYGNGAQLSGILQTDSMLTPDQVARLKSSWSKNYEGAGNKGKTAILESGMKYTPIGLNPVDAAYIETAKLSVEDVSRIFGVPLHMLQSLDRATFNNIEQMSLEFLIYNIRPWLKRIEDEHTRKLIQRQDKGMVYCRFNMDALLRGDTAARGSFYNTMFMIGAFSQNDIRKKENMNAIEGGDIYYRPLNMANILEPTEVIPSEPATDQSQIQQSANE